MSSTLFALSLTVELTKHKGTKVPELLRCACNRDFSQLARNKEYENVVASALPEGWA
jgi:hypothetical protein